MDTIIRLAQLLHLPQHEAHPFLALLVATAYALQTLTVILIIIHGFRQGSYGMPLWGIVSILGICIICGFIGPALQPHLFRRLLDVNLLLWLWRGWTVLMLVVFWQYLWWITTHPHLWPQLNPYIRWLALPLLVVVVYGEWTFLRFYQDVYINAVWPLCILVMSINYVAALFTRVRLRGLSVTVAWLWLASNALLYVGVVFGDMNVPYPCKNGRCEMPCSQTDRSHTCVIPDACGDPACGLMFAPGYDFVYFVYAVTIMANLFYAVELTRRRQELGPMHDPAETLRRIMPALRDGLTSGG